MKNINKLFFFIIPLIFITFLINPTLNTLLDSEEEMLFNLINEYRQNNNLPPLILSSNLTIAAKLHSQDMANNNYFSHYSLDGRSPLQRIRDAGYPYSPIGENIAAGYIKAIDVFNAWKNSVEHNKNMLNKDFKAIGIGRAYNSSSLYKWYWTVDFGGNILTEESVSSTVVTRTIIIYVISYISSYTTIKKTITETITSYFTSNLTYSTTSTIITLKTINQTNTFYSTILETSIISKTINSTILETQITTTTKTNTVLSTSIITTIEKIIEKPIIQFSIILFFLIISILTLISLRKKT